MKDSGHGVQIESESRDEEDGFDEGMYFGPFNLEDFINRQVSIAIVPYAPDGMAEPILDDVRLSLVWPSCGLGTDVVRNQDLRHLLVEPLPPGACLTAIFDSCCSGTLLDLEHYACNNVYVPWINRGKRDIYVTRRAFLRT